MAQYKTFSAFDDDWHYRILGAEGRWSDWQLDPESRNLENAPDIALFAGKVAVFTPRYTYEFEVPDLGAGTAASQVGGDVITAPMPGLVKDLKVQAGDKVAAHDPLLVLEAMKMEHTLTAPRDGIVASVNVELNGQVEDGMVLVSLENEDG